MRVNFRDFIAKFYLGNFMQFPTLKTYLNWAKAHAPKGPFAFIFAQDDIELTHTVAHHIKLGFRQTLVLADVPFTRPADLRAEVAFIARAAKSSSDISQEMNAIISDLPQQWIYCGYNGEYLFYPFCESRSIGEIIAFNTEERRKTIATTVVDLYAGHLGHSPHGVDVTNAYFDRLGYFAETRRDAEHRPLEQQLNIYDGLRWRFEEHVPWHKRRIDRVALFQSLRGLKFQPDFTFNRPEFNTISCPWHHNLTASVCSFRAAKALRHNPGSRHAISSFRWPGSEQFKWHSQQLMDLGFMEPGQWF